MRSYSLAVALAATLLACSGDDKPAPPADQSAAIVAPPSTPSTTESSSSESTTSTSDATEPAAPAKDAKADESATTTTDPAKPADGADDSAFAAAAGALNDCLKTCKDAACGGACLSEFQANLPAPTTPGVQAGSAMCCRGDAFFVCHSADGEDATCNQDGDDPGPNCQAVTAMDIICKAKK